MEYPEKQPRGGWNFRARWTWLDDEYAIVESFDDDEVITAHADDMPSLVGANYELCENAPA